MSGGGVGGCGRNQILGLCTSQRHHDIPVVPSILSCSDVMATSLRTASTRHSRALSLLACRGELPLSRETQCSCFSNSGNVSLHEKLYTAHT